MHFGFLHCRASPSFVAVHALQNQLLLLDMVELFLRDACTRELHEFFHCAVNESLQCSQPPRTHVVAHARRLPYRRSAAAVPAQRPK